MILRSSGQTGSVLIREWLSHTNHQLALAVWTLGIYCVYLIVTGPRGMAGMTQSTQGMLLLTSIACAGPIGWGLLKRFPLAKWSLCALLICQTAMFVNRAIAQRSFKSIWLILGGCWISYELIRWDLSGRIEQGQRALQRLKYVKHKSKPRSFWSTVSFWSAAHADRLKTVIEHDPTHSSTSHPVLLMDRFCGREVYPVRLAEWHHYDFRDDMPPTLHLRVEAGLGTTLHEDTETLRQEPFWTVSICQEGLSISSLVPGARFLVPVGYDESRQDHVTNFFYGTHEVSNQNVVEILQVIDDRMLVRMEGQIADVNFYDSRPPSRVSVETWFIEGS